MQLKMEYKFTVHVTVRNTTGLTEDDAFTALLNMESEYNAHGPHRVHVAVNPQKEGHICLIQPKV
jgi:hypothetical protein